MLLHRSTAVLFLFVSGLCIQASPKKSEYDRARQKILAPLPQNTVESFRSGVPVSSSDTEKNYSVRTNLRPSNLEGFSEALLADHWKLYEGYVAQTNKLLAQTRNMRMNGQGASPEYMALTRRFNFEFDGMVLHEFYFGNMHGTKSAPDMQSALCQTMTRDFGSYEGWRSDFVQQGASRGPGWVILYADPNSTRLINCFIADHELGTLAGAQLVLVMDVWEHAYILDHGALGRASGIEVFMKNIAWPVVQRRYADVMSGIIPRAAY